DVAERRGAPEIAQARRLGITCRIGYLRPIRMWRRKWRRGCWPIYNDAGTRRPVAHTRTGRGRRCQVTTDRGRLRRSNVTGQHLLPLLPVAGGATAGVLLTSSGNVTPEVRRA